MNSVRFKTLLLFVLAAAGARLLPHPANVTPIAAVALFGGARFDRRSVSLLAPLLALLLSDAFLGFHNTLPYVYGAFVLTALMGWQFRERRSPLAMAGASLSASIMFFLVTNLGVWLSGGLYPQSLAGLGACFTAALPFFRNSLLGDLFFTTVLFGGWAMVEHRFPRLQLRTAAI